MDLGDVRELAEIFVNGESAGVVWKPPFRADISSFLKPGKNELKIEVLNLWINRLSGDMKLPDHGKFTSSNIESDGSTRYSPAEPWHEETAGLLGPVRLLPSATVSVQGNNITESGLPVEAAVGVTFNKYKNGSSAYEVESGTYSFGSTFNIN